MKKIMAIILLMLLLLLVGCSASDPLDETLYTTNIYNTSSVETSTLALTTSVYSSTDIPPSSMYYVGSNMPEWKPFPPGNTVLAPLFNAEALEANEEEAFFTVQVPHGYVEGSNIMFYMHYAYMSNSVGDEAKFGIEYIWKNQNEDYGASSNVTRVLTSTNNDRYYHYWVGFPAIDGTGKTIGSILICRIYRNSSDAEDTDSGYVALLGVDLICEVDALGSTTRTTK
jgi:hypothetical protein